TVLLVVSAVAPAVAGPTLSDDLETCRNKQAEDKAARVQAFGRGIGGGQASAKDVGLAYAVRGQAFMQKHAHDKAIAAFSAAHDADPDDPNFLYARGFAYEAKGDNDNAMADYNAVLEKRPKAFNAIYFRGTLYMRKSALQSALDDFNAALSIKPDLYRALADRGHLRTATKDFDGALADFAEAERINPTGPMARNYRCQTYAAMGQFDKALADCNSVIEKEPKNLFALASRADTEQAKGDLTAALKDYNFVLGLNPNHVRAHTGRGQLFEKKHDLAQARADYRSAAFALTPFDNFDLGLARQIARERLAALTPQAATDKVRKIALIIGNGAYKNVQELGNPPRDAKLIAAALKDVGFQTVTLSNDLTRDKFFETLRAFADDAEKADWAVVYYAGHGFEIGGVNYLVPVDARLAADKDAETEAVALEQVID